MAKRGLVFRRWAVQLLAMAAMLPCAVAAGQPPVPLPDPNIGPRVKPEPKVFDQYPKQPSLKPALTIPVAPLGFHPPGSYYLLRRQALVSLDFLDENRLLFTFRQPGLEQRDEQNGEQAIERKIRAVVVALPDGRIESEAGWTVLDEARYLWMLRDGHFLLRDEDGLEQGDATLNTKPYLRLPGHLLWIELDPAEQVIVTNSLEEDAAASTSIETAGPATEPAATTANAVKRKAHGELVVRTLRRETGQTIRTLRVPWDAQNKDWPINAEGYLESVHGDGPDWTLVLNSFVGGTRGLGHLESICQPNAAFAAEAELVVNTCVEGGGGKMIAMSTTNGAQNWNVTTATNAMWPQILRSPDGSRLALETLLLKHPAAYYKHKKLIGPAEIDGQMVRVMDLADSKVKLEAPLNPILDGGGNAVISPSGRRVAILNGGAIEVFELPAPAHMTDSGKK